MTQTDQQLVSQQILETRKEMGNIFKIREGNYFNWKFVQPTYQLTVRQE